MPPVVRAEAVVLAASLPEADPGDVEALSELTDSAAVRSDDGEVQHLAAAAWPGEPYLQRTFTEHMEAAAASLIRAEAPTIRKLVALLEYRPVLDGAAVAACIGEGQS